MRTALQIKFGILILLSSTAQASSTIADNEARAALYDSLFPYSAEYCALTQINMKPGFGETVVGGQYGHSTIYYKGLCRDMSLGYPQVHPCDELPAGPDTADGGVGVSTDYDYQNVNWVAIPSRHFFYWGDLNSGERLTRDVYTRTMKKAHDLGLLDGTVPFPAVFASKPAGMTDEEFRWEDVYGTDFATNQGRTTSCARLPLTHLQLTKIAANLNQINQSARTNGNQFDGISNNCTHTAHNALASAGYWDALPLNVSVAFELFDAAIAYNDFERFMEHPSDVSLNDTLALYRDDLSNKTLMEQSWLPSRYGVVTDVTPAYPDNDVYFTDSKPDFIDVPILDTFESRYNRYVSLPKFTDLRANFESTLAFFQKIKANQQQQNWYATHIRGPNPIIDQRDFSKFASRYYQWIDQQIVDVQAKLNALPKK